jgi:hypothetical protein
MLQTAITHHGTVPNNRDLIPILINIYPQQLIPTTTKNPPTINALAFVDPVGEILSSS